MGNLIAQRESYTRAGKTDDIDRTFTYDGLSRLTETDQYVDGQASKRNVERCLSYDRNGNLLTLIRYADGIQTSNRRYTYTGNRLDRMESDKVFEFEEGEIRPGWPINPAPRTRESLHAGVIFDTSAVIHPIDPGIIMLSRYAHDRNGNLIYDTELKTNFAYNSLNLLEKAMRNDTIVAYYRYLADGTKLSVTSADCRGFSYRGSLTYRTDAGGNRVFESTPFGSGRIVGTAGNETVARYFVTDHLGNVRVVATDKNDVLERNDYYPFGKRWDTASQPVSDNRDRFNGKEDQVFIGDYLADYGARCYNKLNGRWLTQDPLQQYHSPYVFCSNNPIRLVDLNGMEARDSTSVMIPPVIVYPSEDGGSNSNSGYWGAAYDLLIPGYSMWMEAETYRINGEYGHAAARYLLSTFEAGLCFLTAGQSNSLRVGMQSSRIAANSTKLLGRPIIIPAKNLRWNFEKHVLQTGSYVNKSRFYIKTEKELEQLVKAATHVSGYVQTSTGNYIRIVNAGKTIGFDITANSSTTVYTVITNSHTGKLISIFPGLPKY